MQWMHFANSLGLTAVNPAELEMISKIIILSESLQGIIDCVEKKLYDIDSSFQLCVFMASRALVNPSGLVGGTRLNFCDLGASRGQELLILFTFREHSVQTSQRSWI